MYGMCHRIPASSGLATPCYLPLVAGVRAENVANSLMAVAYAIGSTLAHGRDVREVHLGGEQADDDENEEAEPRTGRNGVKRFRNAGHDIPILGRRADVQLLGW